MIELIFEAFQFSFMIRAFLVGMMIAISGASLGTFLVLKRFSMIGHGLAHVAFGAVAVGLLTQQQPLLVAMPIVVLVSVLILKLNETANVHADAAIGLAATFAMAFGTILASVGGGFRVELNTYLFGSILTVQNIDVILASLFTVLMVVFVIYFYHDLFAMTYDENYARVSGVNTQLLNTMLAVFAGILVVLGIRLVGTILISSFIIFPAVIAMQFGKGFRTTLVLAVMVSLATVFFGLLGSYVYDTPSGSTIVVLNGLVFVAAYVYHKIMP